MAKHKYIETPEKMWGLFEAYRDEVKGNPRIRIEYVGRDGQRVETPIERPLIMEGFRSFARSKGFSIEHYFANTDNSYNDYRTVITRIREEIRAEQIDGGMLKVYDSNITARLNGLKDQTETTSSHNVKLLTIDPLADDDSIKEDSEPKE